MKKIIISWLVFFAVANAEFLRDDTKEVVLDTTTNLMWQDNSEAKTVTKTWSEAITYCEDLTLGGFNDWHLPNFNELYYLADRSKYNPAINQKFNNVVSSVYWTSTALASSDMNNAWIVYFSSGNSYLGDPNNTTNSYYVRCVRVAD